MAEILRVLRENGYSMGESSVAIAEGLNLDLGAAQRLVTESDVWADHRIAQAEVQERFWRALEQLGKRQDGRSIEMDLSDFDGVA